MSEEKQKKEKPVLTEEEKAEKLSKRLSDNLATIKIGLKLKDEDERSVILSKAGKLPQAFVDKAVESGQLTKKQAEQIKELGLIGVVRSVGTSSKTPARPWRWQIDADKEGLVGKALIDIETGLADFEEKNKENLALVTKFFLDNEGTEKVFATYFAKKAVKKEKDADKGNNKS